MPDEQSIEAVQKLLLELHVQIPESANGRLKLKTELVARLRAEGFEEYVGLLLTYDAVLGARKGTSPGRPVVISLHGIRTRGDWQKHLSPALAEADFIPQPLDYGFFRAIQLVLPFMRNRKVEWFLKEYTAIRKQPGTHPPSIIAHSLGTYLVARALEKYDEVKFDRIIFCGSIVNRSYPWTTIFDRKQATRVLNDYGGKNFWARAAEWVVKDSGPSGAEGFNDKAGGRVVERFRPDFRHSDFFYSLNYETNWIPFLKGNDPSPDVQFPKRLINWKFRTVLIVVPILVFLVLWLILRPGTTPDKPKNEAWCQNLEGLWEQRERGTNNLGPYTFRPLYNQDKTEVSARRNEAIPGSTPRVPRRIGGKVRTTP